MAPSPYVIDYRGIHRFPVEREELWAAIAHVDRFEAWWGWLSEFSVEGPADGSLQAGSVLRGVVSPPLPYRMRLVVVIERCQPPESIEAGVHGDLEGDATLILNPRPGGTDVTVSWKIEMMQRTMRVAARVAHPVLHWGHDRVVEATVQSFLRQLGRGA